MDLTAARKDPAQPQCEEVLSIEYKVGVSRSGNEMVTVDITTPRRKFPVYLLENSNWQAQKKMGFARATNNFTETPRTIKYKKDGDFWEVIGFGMPTDEEVISEKIKSSGVLCLSA
jgi:hypothetical protein